MNKFLKYFILRIAIAGLLFNLINPVYAQYSVLHHFTGEANDGGWPALGGFIESDSFLYGVTAQGGSNNNGTIFRIKKDGTNFELLYSFFSPGEDGSKPYGSLLISDSAIYGMAGSEGFDYNGTFYRLDTNGANFRVLHHFTGSEGKWPYAATIKSDSVFYGMTTYGGNDTSSGWSGGGTIFRMNADGSGFQLLHTFMGGSNDGYGPHGSLIQSGSTLYGTTLIGGYGSGTIFKINTDGTGFQLLRKFTSGSNDGGVPYGTTLLQSGSTFYGMTQVGGSRNRGTIFKMNTDGSGFGLLHSFIGGGTDGQQPLCGSLILSGSTMYGMTTNGGTNDSGCVFTININGSGYRLLHNFNGSDGSNPYGELFLSDSTLYGMTSNGGGSYLGVIFALDLRQITGIHQEKETGTIENFRLEQNYPNPFNPTTTIQYSLDKSSQVKLNIYNVLGQRIKTLVSSFQSAGEHSMVWDGKDNSNNPVVSGTYFYCLAADNMILRKKMILIR